MSSSWWPFVSGASTYTKANASADSTAKMAKVHAPPNAPSAEAFGSVGPHEGAVTKVESHGEEQDADDGQHGRGARGESDDEDGASDAHSGDPSQQYRSAPQPVDQEEGPHNCRDGEQLDDGRHEDGSARTLDAHLLDNRRTVVDDCVDPGDLHQKAQAHNEDAGPPKAPAEELGEAALLIIAQIPLDYVGFLLRIYVGIDSPQHLHRLGPSAHHHEPASRVRQA